MKLNNPTLEVFGCLKSPGEATVIIKGEFLEPDDADMFSHDADIAFIIGPAGSIRGYYRKLVEKYEDTESKEWLNDEGCVGFAYYPLLSDQSMVACIDHDLGVFGEEPDLELPEGCSMVVVVHANQERCLYEQPVFFAPVEEKELFIF